MHEEIKKQSFIFHLRSAVLRPNRNSVLFAVSMLIFASAVVTGAVYYISHNDASVLFGTFGLSPGPSGIAP
jgi:hypothetical protein